MKTKLTAIALTVFAIVLGLSISGCTKEGPAGPAGKDVNASCGECHNNNTFLLAKQTQYATSAHATGSLINENTTQCAPCHTSEGFREVILSGADSCVATISNPTTQNCRTCHNIHTNYDSTDFSLTSKEAFTLRIGNHAVNVDFGEGNLCAHCHQGRALSPALPAYTDNDTTHYTPYALSSHFGAHNSTAANVLSGTGGWDLPGTATKENSAHTNGMTNYCIQCHMSNVVEPNLAGGHTWWVNYMSGSSELTNFAGCASSPGCHPTYGITDYKGKNIFAINKIATYKTLLGNFRSALAKNNLIDTSKSGGVFSSDAVIAKTVPSLYAGLVYNYMFLVKDRSWGVHNLAYSTYLAQNSFEKLP